MSFGEDRDYSFAFVVAPAGTHDLAHTLDDIDCLSALAAPAARLQRHAANDAIANRSDHVLIESGKPIQQDRLADLVHKRLEHPFEDDPIGKHEQDWYVGANIIDVTQATLPPEMLKEARDMGGDRRELRRIAAHHLKLWNTAQRIGFEQVCKDPSFESERVNLAAVFHEQRTLLLEKARDAAAATPDEALGVRVPEEGHAERSRRMNADLAPLQHARALPRTGVACGA